jgi:transcriptional regulator with XRE-family HTH domain
MPHRHGVRFPRAYLAALDAAGLSKSQAATLAGLTQSGLSRFLSGERPIYADHMRAMLRALHDPADREHCLLEWLRDQCPGDLGDRLVAHFGEAREPRALPAQADELDRAVAVIRRAAENGNIAARKVVVNLAKAVDEDEPPDKTQRISDGGPPDTVSRQRAASA